MAINPLQIGDLNASLLHAGYQGEVIVAKEHATEVTMFPDNLNNQLAQNTLPMGVWNPFTWGLYQGNYSEGTNNAGSWLIPNGQSTYHDDAVKPIGGFFIRQVVYQNESTNFGTIGALVGGILNANYSFNQVNAGEVDYEPAYGHGVATWPMPNDLAHQFRDSNSLPSDGASAIDYTQTWTRSPYLHPVVYFVHIINGGTIASGNVKFIIEQRPTCRMTMNNHAQSPLSAGAYEIFPMFPNRTTNTRALLTYLGRMNYMTATQSAPNEDGTGVFSNSSHYDTPSVWDADVYVDFPILRARTDETRIMTAATFVINQEYFGAVQGSALMVFSNKGNAIPLQFWDLALTWPSAAHKRIAGVAVDPATMNIWILAESGELAVLDFSVSGGQMLTKAAAPVLSGGERYGALALISGVLWAMVGAWTPKATDTSTTGTTIGVNHYTLASNTWGTRSNSSLPGRHNTRHLGEMIATREGYLAFVSEIVSADGSNVTNTAGPGSTSNYQLMLFNPLGSVWNPSVISKTGAMTATWSGNFWRTGTVGFLKDVVGGKLLIQMGWDNNKLFVYDYSDSWSDDSGYWTDVSIGTAGSILGTTNPDPSRPMVNIIKNLTDDSVLFHYPCQNAAWPSSNANPPVYFAHPGFAWDGTEQLVTYGSNWTGDTTSTLTVDKNNQSFTELSGMSQYDTYHYTGNESRFLTHFTDNQFTYWGSSMGGWGSEYVYPCNLMFTTIYLPTYWKWDTGSSAWVKAKNWADAVANPKSVPSTPGTNLAILDGLSISFGPGTSTTFLAGEFHTMNMAYGNVKFSRRARYSFTMFAGRTFQQTDTRTLTAIKALPVLMVLPPVDQRPMTVSGPSGITAWGSAATWPTVTGTGLSLVANDIPAVVTYDLTLWPAAPSIVPNMTAATNGAVTVSSSTTATGSGFTLWGAWTRGVNTPSSAGTGGWGATGSGPEWTQVDFGGGNAKTVRSYMVAKRPMDANGNDWTTPMTAWSLRGSNDAGSTWTTLDSVTDYAWGHGFLGDNMGSCPPCFRTVSSPAPYQIYQLYVPGGDGGSRVEIAAIELYDVPLVTTGARFSDVSLPARGHGQASGYKFEVNTGTGFTPITPLWSSHHREHFVFPLQTGVQAFRITSYGGASVVGNPALRCQVSPAFWDYGTSGQINAARLGSSGASDNTSARGSFDTQCIGVADMPAISMDGLSPEQFTPAWSSDINNAYLGWYNYGPHNVSGTKNYTLHPFFGFLAFSPDVTGTSVQVSYSWGRRV